MPEQPSTAAKNQKNYSLQEAWAGSARVPGSEEFLLLLVAPDPVQAVIRETTAVIGTPRNELTDPARGVNYAAGPPESTLADGIYISAAYALLDMPSQLVEAPLRKIVQGGDPLVRLYATECLVRHGFYDSLNAVLPLLLDPPPDASLAASMVAQSFNRRPAPEAIAPTLVRLLASTNPIVRGESGQELGWATHAPRSITPAGPRKRRFTGKNERRSKTA